MWYIRIKKNVLCALCEWTYIKKGKILRLILFGNGLKFLLYADKSKMCYFVLACQNDPPGSNALHKQIVEVFVRSKWSEDCVIMPHRHESYLKDSSSACDGKRIDVHRKQIEYFVGSLTNFRRWFITNIDTLPLNLI